ncbi:MAG: hypothetical protein IJP99_10795 [Methanobrevibacter sp.]|nr:hypothetical protein [Methanobrevibacter sp.]
MRKDYWYDFINMLYDSNPLRATHFFKTHIVNIFILPKRITSTSVYMILTYLKKSGVTKQQLLTYYREIENHWDEIETYSFLKSIVKED